ncbi:MAG: methyltransferase [Rhodanobacter sp.]
MSGNPHRFNRSLAFALALGVAAVAPLAIAAQAPAAQPAAASSDVTIDGALAGTWRSDANRARDAARHPAATLRFFDVRPDQTVIEITPGGGWYSEVLAPLLRDRGHYIAAVAAPTDKESRSEDSAIKRKFAADPADYGRAALVEFDPHAPVFGPPASADRVLTFRNVHNWGPGASAMFKAFFDVLKPGGVLGVVDHRAAKGASYESVRKSGYLPTAYIVKLATDAGFKLDASSEINANPRDTKDHAKGVWTLPPTYAMGETDKAKYAAIGESDRMTLRFVKPAAAR